MFISVLYKKTITIHYIIGVTLVVIFINCIDSKGIYRILYYLPLLVIPVGSLIITCYFVTNWSDEPLKKAEILDFIGQYIAFCGSFCLGYFIFINEKERRREKQIDDINHLRDIISRSGLDLINLRNIAENATSNNELRGIVRLITTEDWYSYYREYEHIYGTNHELKEAIDIYFRRIENINQLIKDGLIIEANKLNQKYIEDDYYNTMDYNPGEILFEFGNNSIGFYHKETWNKQKDTRKKILYICENYADIIETLIYNYMKIQGIHVSDATTTNIVITNQLIEKSEYFNTIVRFPTDKRIITKAITICSYNFKRHSKTHKIELIWGEYNLCDEYDK